MKKIYDITGFDCANCAAKVERHLSKHPKFNNCRLDFQANKLYADYKGDELTIEELKEIIKEVETDELEITENGGEVKKTKIFDKSFFVLLARVLFGVLVLILSYTAFPMEMGMSMPIHECPNYWVNFWVYLAAAIVLSYDIVWKVVNRIIHKENPIDEFLLITISVFGAFIIAAIDSGDFMESIMVVALFQVGRMFEGVATNKSKEAIMAAVDLRVSTANLVLGEKIKQVRPEELKIGDTVIVNAGEMIPTDGVISKGKGNIDTSSLTGEFVPVAAKEGESVFAGCMVKDGSVFVTVSKEYKDSAVAKIMELVSASGERKSKTDKFITRFARLYTPIVFVVSILFAVIGGAVTGEWSLFVLTGLKMLVIACPCAVVISVPMAFFSAIGLASKNGIVIKGTSYFDELIRLKKLVSDKTGTITKGSFEISKVVTNEGVNEEELLNSLYAAECLSNHPIAKAICHGKDLETLAKEQKEFEEIAGYGIKTIYENKQIYAGNQKLMEKAGVSSMTPSEVGTIIHVAKENAYLGYVVLSDTIKEEAKTLVDYMHKEKIEVVLLTGDKKENALAISDELGIDRCHAELLPGDKTMHLESEMAKNHEYSVAYIGDGINDAASIKMADIGIAMGAIGSDIAVENADIVIMNDDPSKVKDAHKISKIAHGTAKFNLITALAVKLSIEAVAIVFTLLNHFGINAWSLPMWAAVLADTGLTVVLVINSLMVLYRKVR